MNSSSFDPGIAALSAAYRERSLHPREVVAAIHANIERTRAMNIWIDVLDDVALEPYLARLDRNAPSSLPLWGIPFAIKDNIDLANRPTTAACPAYSYTPSRSAFVVEQLLAAGALPIGKTNLDQFAAGLVGTRSPYGVTANAFDPHYVSGGSSAGSAVAVALGQASFALGTDTAGSGRIPAAFNNLVGIKPTRGLLSTRGVVPACRSLDCVSVFALDFHDAASVLRIAAASDADDPYARRFDAVDSLDAHFVFGVPDTCDFVEASDRALFESTISRLKTLGGVARSVPIAPFAAAARLLYEGPWIAERYAGIADFLARCEDQLHPVTRAIIAPARSRSAVEYFDAAAALARLQLECTRHLHGLACLLLPAAPLHPTQAAVAADPISVNTRLGTYTNFMNLLDLAGVAVPAGWRDNGLPFGVTLCAPAGHDARLATLGARLHAAGELPRGALGLALAPASSVDVCWQAPVATFDIAVCGAHMAGLALNAQLTSRGGYLLECLRTAPCYRLYALPGGPPARPGLVRQRQGGMAIDIEIWRLPAAAVGSFMAAIPAPLGIGRLALEDGREVAGFLCEASACTDARDISALGGWRAYLAERSNT